MQLNFPLAPPQASSFAAEHDAIFYVLVLLTLVFTSLVMLALVFLVIRYREGTKASRLNPSFGDLRLESAWSIIPLLLGVVMFFFSANLFIKMRTMPKDATEIYMIGKQWMWHAQHPNGVRENNTLHVPIGRPVKLTMISQDVIHAVYIPAFRVQYHVVPGRYSQMWFTPTQEGEYHLFCGMYCGTQHSEMGGRVIAMQPAAYAEWLANNGQKTPPMTMVQAGKAKFEKIGCANCHGGADSIRAPSLVGLLGKPRQFSNAAEIKADEAYIRESILRPYNRLNKGYGQTMPAYEGQVTEEDVLNMITYIKSLGGGTESVSDARKGSVPVDTERQPATPTNSTNRLSVGAVAEEENRR